MSDRFGGGSAPAATPGGIGPNGRRNQRQRQQHRDQMQRQRQQQHRQNMGGGPGGGGGGGGQGGGGGGGGGLGKVDATGPGSNAYNDSLQAVNAGLGTLRRVGVGAPPLPGQAVTAPGATSQSAWLTNQMTDLYNEFVGDRAAMKHGSRFTWTKNLKQRFSVPPLPGQPRGLRDAWKGNMGRYYSSLYSRESPEDRRGYPIPELVGPGRVVTQ